MKEVEGEAVCTQLPNITNEIHRAHHLSFHMKGAGVFVILGVGGHVRSPSSVSTVGSFFIFAFSFTVYKWK